MSHQSSTYRWSALLLIPVAACSDLPARTRTTDAPVVSVAARDFSFRAPDTIMAGLTRILLTNEGRERHHMQLARLERGHTIRELGDSLTASNRLPSWVTFMGGPNEPVPGGPSEVLVRLAPGSYAMLCFVSSPDGVPHLAKGMLRGLAVVPGDAPILPEPQADVRLTLEDYDFAFTPWLTRGRKTIRVENIGPQPHEAIFVRLAPGKTADDVLAWLKRQDTPPPGKTFGGTMALQRGQVNFIMAEFTPGEYALLCFVPDSGDGKPHVAHGMVRQFTVP
ncbi:MAG TPA: hypothetical protein VFM14_16240 [Gemmatimonadales bacterium]|nr:hypothetical protein [Gemmatimonadales bacterium]